MSPLHRFLAVSTLTTVALAAAAHGQSAAPAVFVIHLARGWSESDPHAPTDELLRAACASAWTRSCRDLPWQLPQPQARQPVARS